MAGNNDREGRSDDWDGRKPAGWIDKWTQRMDGWMDGWMRRKEVWKR